MLPLGSGHDFGKLVKQVNEVEKRTANDEQDEANEQDGWVGGSCLHGAPTLLPVAVGQ